MNIKELLELLNKRYTFLVECEKQISNFYRFKISYENINFYVTYTFSGMVDNQANYFGLCKKIEQGIIDYFRKR